MTVCCGPSFVSQSVFCESRYDGALVFVEDELLEFIAVEDFHERLDFRTAFIAFTDGDDVDVGGCAIFEDQRFLGRNETNLQCIVRVDDGCVHVLEGARNLFP